MSDNYNISYSYQMGTAEPQPAPPQNDEMIAFTNCELIDLGGMGTMLLNKDTGKQLIVTNEVAIALTHLTTFQTLQTHAQNLVETIPQLNGQLEDVTKVLTMVNDAGMMLSASTICERLNKQPVTATELAPTRVCVITCDRPQAVERLLDSMLRAGNLSQHDALFLVDDSRDPGNREQNRELVSKFNLNSPRDMRYVGVAAQQRLISELVSQLPENENAIRFLVDRERWTGHKTYGLSRTFCLLLSVGYRCIVLDDDVLCKAVKPPIQKDGISFGGGGGRELACFGSEAELMQNAVFESFDPLAGHAGYLGKDLGGALAEMGVDLEPAALRNSNAAMLTTMADNSPILVTQCGSWGDPGTSNSSWWFHLGQDSIARAIAAPGGITEAMKSRHYWLGRPHHNIAKMAVMSQATGLDNTRLLPPYFPAFRGEDYLFASMVACLHPDSAVLDYAWSVPHLPIERRDDRAATEVSAARASLALCARYLGDMTNFEMGPCAQTKLQGLAAHLRELGEREPASLLAILRKELTTMRAEQVTNLQQQVQSAPKLGSSDWVSYLQRSIEEVSRELQSPVDLMSTPDVDASAGEAAIVQSFQDALTEFGNALAAWPGIRRASAQIILSMLESGELS